MRHRLLLPAVLIALLSQPALLSLAHGDDASPGFDPLRVTPVLYLAPEGRLADAPPVEGSVPAPQGLPGQPGLAVWARDMPAGELRGVATLTLKAQLDLPAVTPPGASGLFNATLRRGTAMLASVEAGPVLATPGPLSLTFKLNVDDAPFQAGDGLALEVSFAWLELDAVPTVHYLLGPGGSTLQVAESLASLDQLGHAHAAGDQHALQSAYRVRTGNLGGGLWGVDLPLGERWDGTPVVLDVPAGVPRLLLQISIPADLVDPPASLSLDLPGGKTTVYRGEVVVREVPRIADGATLACLSCGADARPATLRLSGGSGGAPGAPEGQPVTPNALPSASAYPEEDQGHVFVLVVPALLMLGGVMLYAVRKELQREARVPRGAARGSRLPAKAQVRAPSRSIKPARPLQPARPR